MNALQSKLRTCNYWSTTSLDIDECEHSPCDPNAICDNTPGSFNCACLLGYNGTGIVCYSKYFCVYRYTRDYEDLRPAICVACA